MSEEMSTKVVSVKLEEDIFEKLERLYEHTSARVLNSKQFVSFALDHLTTRLSQEEPQDVLLRTPEEGRTKSISVFLKDYRRARDLSKQLKKSKFAIYYSATRHYLALIEEELGTSSSVEES